MNPNPRCLGDLEEGIGDLQKVAEQEGFTLARFRGFSLLLPLELKQQLSSLTGLRVGIFRIDNAFRIRVDKENSNDSDNRMPMDSDECLSALTVRGE
jgi:hypothetical protein